MASDQVYRLVVDDQDLAKLRRRKALAGHELAQIPASDDARVVYSTAPIGEPVRHLAQSLTSDFAAMPNDTRRRSLSAGWAAVVLDLADELEAKREPWECEGRIGRSMEQVVVVAQELGVLAGRGPWMLVIEVMDPATENRFKALVKLRRGYPRRQAEAA